jgi:hypothetical protein
MKMKHTVIYKYLEGAGMTVTREMTQEELGQLLLKAIMQMKDSEIDTKHGFCNVIRTLTNSDKSDQEIMHLIWSDSTLTMNWTIYQNFCNWERARRKVAKEYARKHPVMHLLHKGKQFLKGGE